MEDYLRFSTELNGLYRELNEAQGEEFRDLWDACKERVLELERLICA